MSKVRVTRPSYDGCTGSITAYTADDVEIFLTYPQTTVRGPRDDSWYEVLDETPQTVAQFRASQTPPPVSPPAPRATQPGEANARTIGTLRERLAAERVTR